MIRILTAACIALASFASPAFAEPAKPQRIVTLNLCADELVLRLVDRSRVASVTWLARDPLTSTVAEIAAQVPVNHGLAEEIVPQRPDLVIAGFFTARTAVALIERSGIPVRRIALARNVAEVRAQMTEVAEMVGERARGTAMVRDFDTRLAAVKSPKGARRLHALVLNPNGFTTGQDSLVDAIIAAAGLVNVAPQVGLGGGGQVPLEAVALAGVDVLILNAERDGAPSLATELLRHPVLEALSKRIRIAVLPARLWTCGGPALIEAIELLARIAAAPAATAGALR
jgi:iron complex transport system substrate-binding protein